MAEKSTSIDWAKVIMAVVIVALGFFGLASFMRANSEENKRIESQNRIAQMSKVIQEKENLWSRLSQQQEDVIGILRRDNEGLADQIEKQGDTILALSETVVKMKSVRVVVRHENITQDPVEPTEPGGDERLRVSFHENVDPISVEGFTLTNPPEAEVTVGFTRPLKLRTVITQQQDGAWRTYVEGDWPNLDIQQIETVVNPRAAHQRSFVENIVVGGNLLISPDFDDVVGNINLGYSLGSFSVGPSLGIALVNDNASFVVGFQSEWKPFYQN